MTPENEKMIRALEYAPLSPKEWESINGIFHEIHGKIKGNSLYDNPDKWFFFYGMQYGKMLGIKAERKKRKEKKPSENQQLKNK